MFDFTPSEEQAALHEMARRFGVERLGPGALAWEEEGTLPVEILREAGALGMGTIYMPEEAGGAGLTRLDGALIFEGLAMGCPSVAAFISIHNMVAWMVGRYGAPEQARRWAAKLSSMETVASYCLTEPGSGSDAAALRTTARRDGDGYVLNGSKAFISGAGFSDLYLIMARTGGEGPRGVSAFLVEKDTPGLSFGGVEKKMGWKAQPTAQVQLDDCRVPAENLLGEEGAGFKYAMAGLDGGRLNIAACSLGGAQAAYEAARRYMGERKAFGQTIDQFQALQFRLADMATSLEASRVLLRQAAAKLDAGASDATKHCAMAKRFVTDVCFDVADEALQLHGGYGYLADYGVEKIVRDLRVHRILEGTNEIMRVIIARHALAERDTAG
ncbi:MAG: acyl-CoA dehydrogenase family protein [Pseudomonadota bacterium]